MLLIMFLLRREKSYFIVTFNFECEYACDVSYKFYKRYLISFTKGIFHSQVLEMSKLQIEFDQNHHQLLMKHPCFELPSMKFNRRDNAWLKRLHIAGLNSRLLLAVR